MTKHEENLINISLNAGYLSRSGLIEIEDSSELCNTICSMAQSFEKSGYDEANYLGEIDIYSRVELIKKYSSCKEESC